MYWAQDDLHYDHVLFEIIVRSQNASFSGVGFCTIQISSYFNLDCRDIFWFVNNGFLSCCTEYIIPNITFNSIGKSLAYQRRGNFSKPKLIYLFVCFLYLHC